MPTSVDAMLMLRRRTGTFSRSRTASGSADSAVGAESVGVRDFKRLDIEWSANCQSPLRMRADSEVTRWA